VATRPMRSDLSAWVVWVCPRCGFEVTRHENTPLEPWCIYCNVHLVAAEEDLGVEVEGLA
jgi:hypothetical protein